MLQESVESQSRNSSDNDDSLCQICMDNEKDVRLECGHCIYCEDCIKKINNPVCPTCRAPINRYYKDLKHRESFIDPENGRVDWGKVIKMRKRRQLPKLYKMLVDELGIIGGTVIFIFICIGMAIYAFFLLSEIIFPIIYMILGIVYQETFIGVYGLICQLSNIFDFLRKRHEEDTSQYRVFKKSYYFAEILNTVLFIYILNMLFNGYPFDNIIKVFIIIEFSTFILLAICFVYIVIFFVVLVIIAPQLPSDTEENVENETHEVV